MSNFAGVVFDTPASMLHLGLVWLKPTTSKAHHRGTDVRSVLRKGLKVKGLESLLKRIRLKAGGCYSAFIEVKTHFGHLHCTGCYSPIFP